MNINRVLVAGALLAAAQLVWAADTCGCNAGLVQDVVRTSSNSRVQLAYISQIDEHQYQELKRQGGGSGQLGGLISGSNSYQDFSTQRRDYLSRQQFSLSSEQSSSLVTTTYNTAAWTSCKRECIRRQTGFACDLSEVARQRVIASCSWRPEGSGYGRSNVSVVRNSATGSNRDIDPGTTRDWQFDRDPREDLHITFTLDNGSSSSVSVAAVPPDAETVPETVLDRLSRGVVCMAVLSGGWGSLIGGQEYEVRYSRAGNVFNVTGLHNRTKKRETYPYTNASLAAGQVSLWGVQFNVDANGAMRGVGSVNVGGTLRCPT